jgi:glycosyltransferase involved in cell wall biosynthesis
MRILILEEALQNGAGHWPVYLGDITRGLRQAGDTVDLLAHRQADPALLASLHATAWLSRSCWSDPRAQGQVGGIHHALRFARELRRWLRQQRQPYQWICSLTMRLPHLLAYTLLVRSGQIPTDSRCLLLFVQGFGVYGGHDQPLRCPATPSDRLAAWCFQRLRASVASGQVLLAAETAAMQEELAAFSGLPITLFPHPVAISVQGSANPPAVERPRAGPITITCPGFARYEKGSDMLLQAIRKLWAQPRFAEVHLVCQWPQPFAMPDGTMLSPPTDLLNDPRLEFLNHNLDSGAYRSLLERSDLIVLPYRSESYHNRVSRVAIEALLLGVPLLAMVGTWAAELAATSRNDLLIEGESAEHIAEALSQAVDSLNALAAQAIVHRTAVAKVHSVDRFRDRLLHPPRPFPPL